MTNPRPTPQALADEILSDAPPCRLCGSQLTPLGFLGKRLHLRCRACGTDQSFTVMEEPKS